MTRLHQFLNLSLGLDYILNREHAIQIGSTGFERCVCLSDREGLTVELHYGSNLSHLSKIVKHLLVPDFKCKDLLLLFFIMVKNVLILSLGCGALVKQKKQFVDISLGHGKL